MKNKIKTSHVFKEMKVFLGQFYYHAMHLGVTRLDLGARLLSLGAA